MSEQNYEKQSTATVPVDKLIFPPEDIALRPPPKPSDKDWDEIQVPLEQDIADKGLLNLFPVRDCGDGTFMVLDGSRRATAVINLFNEGHPRFKDGVLVQLRNEADLDATELQIAANFNQKKTPNTKYITALKRILIGKNYTIDELAKKVGMNAAYINNLLKLDYLPDAAKNLLDTKDITVTNAIELNKLPQDEIDDYLEKAQTMSGVDFTTEVAKRLNEISKEKKAAREGKEVVFIPSARYMKKDEAAVGLERAKQSYEDDSNDFNLGYLTAYQEIFHLDEKSVSKAEEEFNKKKEEAEKNKAERKKAREAKKTIEALEQIKAQGVALTPEQQAMVDEYNKS